MATIRHQRRQQAERLTFLEKRIQELAREKHLMEILVEHMQPQIIILEAKPKPAPVPSGLEHIRPWQPPGPDSFLSEHPRTLIQEYPGMLFHFGIPNWQVGLTLDRSRLVFVPHVLYGPYEQECLAAVGWSEQQEGEWYDSMTITNEDDPELDGEYTPDIPNPLRRQGVWKARQVVHWTGEMDIPEVDWPCWNNGTWG